MKTFLKIRENKWSSGGYFISNCWVKIQCRTQNLPDANAMTAITRNVVNFILLDLKFSRLNTVIQMRCKFQLRTIATAWTFYSQNQSKSKRNIP